MNKRLFELWGKTTQDDHYHPALYHMIDVAHAAQALMSHGGSARVRAAIEHTWRGANIEALCEWLPFLVALHDLGKISAPFQGQRTTPQAARQVDRLVMAGFSFPTASVDTRLPHSILSALFIHEHLTTLETGVSSQVKTIVRDAASGHHGCYDASFGPVCDALDYLDERTTWEPLRVASYRYLRDILAPRRSSMADIGTPTHHRPATIAFTGLIILADWLGSNANFFPPDCISDPDTYIETSRDRALAAVQAIGFDAPRQVPDDTTCGVLFPECAIAPRPLQQAIDQLHAIHLQRPVLYIIEAPTGEGKTEAALTLARRLTAHGASDELFFALPTMATSNQMFKRTSRFYARLYGENGAVKLAHGQAALLESELRRAATLEPCYIDHGDSTDPQALASGETALAWFSSSKRALLAPFGTGTVDQVELGGLKTRYYMLRLFALACKTVIIDEVHAYDTYMNTILDHTLTWLAALGSSVILLSATLPSQRHTELATAFQQGLGGSEIVPATNTRLTYPVIARYQAGQHDIISVAAFRPQQQLTIRWVHDATPEAQAQRLIDLVAQGGAVARICNRVADAQQIYAALQTLAGADSTVLIHARMPLDQRTSREGDVERLVGSESRRTPLQRIILIGTQVLEQSLDYDVDVMVSDLAPIDLLLQRAGRLQRHQRERVAPFDTNATLYVQHGWNEQHMPDISRWEMIYAPYVLYRTWQALDQRTAESQAVITLPTEYRPLIETVYAAYQPEAADGLLAPDLEAAWTQSIESAAKMSEEARVRLVPRALARDSITAGGSDVFLADEDGGMQGWLAAKTRLGDRITTIPIYRHAADRLTLDPAGTIWLPHKRSDQLSLAQHQQLLQQSLPISSPEWLLNKLRKEEWRWRAVPPALKYLFPLYLYPDGTALLSRRIQLDPALGLIIHSEVV